MYWLYFVLSLDSSFSLSRIETIARSRRNNTLEMRTSFGTSSSEKKGTKMRREKRRLIEWGKRRIARNRLTTRNWNPEKECSAHNWPLVLFFFLENRTVIRERNRDLVGKEGKGFFIQSVTLRKKIITREKGAKKSRNNQ